MYVVIGSITKDTIYHPGRAPRTGLGGIMYSTFALAALCEGEAVVPLANVGDDVYEDVIHTLSPFRDVRIHGIQRVEEDNIHCHILAVGDYGVQYDEGMAIPLTFAQLSRFRDADYAIVNYTAGQDLSLRSLRALRGHSECLLHLDFHCAILGRRPSGERFVRRPRSWLSYLRLADVLQVNAFEASVLLGQKIASQVEAKHGARRLLGLGPRRASIITCGHKGAAFAYQGGKGTRAGFVDAIPIVGSGESIGCGDTFGAAFGAALRGGADIEDACAAASGVASLIARSVGLEAYPVGEIRSVYGSLSRTPF